jgi:hypothetical protein
MVFRNSFVISFNIIFQRGVKETTSILPLTRIEGVIVRFHGFVCFDIE